MKKVAFSLRLLLVIALNVAVSTDNDEVGEWSTTGDVGLSRNVSWWAESVSLALGDVATRALGHDQLQQLYENSVCMTSLTPDDVNISQHVLDAAALFSQFISITLHDGRRIAVVNF